MISGPIPPHPRALLQDLWLEPEATGLAEARPSLKVSSSAKKKDADPTTRGPKAKASQGDLREDDPRERPPYQGNLDSEVFHLESGWKLLASDLCFGKGLDVDFLGMDANRTPIAVLALGEEDQDLCPLKLLDLKAWFQRNKELIRQTWMRICPELISLDLCRDLRFFLIAHEFSPSLIERLSCLSSFDLLLFRLRSLGVRGQQYWYAEGVAPWAHHSQEVSPFEAPSGVEAELLRERINTFLSRVQVVGEGLVGRSLDFEGDRFDRRALIENELVLELGVDQGQVWIRIPGIPDEFLLGTDEEQSRVLDCFLRSLMARNHPTWGSVPLGNSPRKPEQTQNEGKALGGRPEPQPREDRLSSSEPEKDSPWGRGNPCRSSKHAERSEGTRLSDEEMAAFFGS